MAALMKSLASEVRAGADRANSVEAAALVSSPRTSAAMLGVTLGGVRPGADSANSAEAHALVQDDCASPPARIISSPRMERFTQS